MLLPPATKLGQGNIFRSVCQQFCPQGGCAWLHGRVGHAWFYLGGMRGFIPGGVCGFICGGVRGFIWGACVVLFRGACMVLLQGVCMVLFRGACVVFSVFSDTMRYGQ